MKKITTIVALVSILSLAGCASTFTEYKAFEGVKAAIIDGKGGAKVVVDGMEIWEDGEPPRKFKILGFIDDTREVSWIDMWIQHGDDRGDIVEQSRKAGGDAVIKLNKQSQLEDFYSAGGASANVYGVYVRTTHYDSPENNVSKYAVIKYVH
jgi:hypothetical protein